MQEAEFEANEMQVSQVSKAIFVSTQKLPKGPNAELLDSGLNETLLQRWEERSPTEEKLN